MIEDEKLPFMRDSMDKIVPSRFFLLAPDEQRDSALEKEYSSFTDLQLQMAIHKIFIEFESRALRDEIDQRVNVQDSGEDLALLGQRVVMELIRRTRLRDL